MLRSLLRLCGASLSCNVAFSSVRHHLAAPFVASRRKFSLHAGVGPRDIRTVEIPSRSNGIVSVQIHAPLVGDDAASPTIIYLPAGPVLGKVNDDQTHDIDRNIISALSASSNATVLRVNYRLGNGTTYPTPVHDVLTVYDWAKEQLAAEDGLLTRRGTLVRRVAKLGACGQLVGGSLALMLALTECKLGETRPAAIVAHNPIVDWIFPEETKPIAKDEVDDEKGEIIEESEVELQAEFDRVVLQSKGKKKKRKSKAKPKKPVPSWHLYQHSEQISAQTILRARESIFRKPAHYFDPFASPILFFRSPGADVPIDPSLLSPDCHPLSPEDALLETQLPAQQRRRVHRKHPPAHSSLAIPSTYLSLSEQTVLLDQGLEMARLMRRSVEKSWTAHQRDDLRYETSDSATSGAVVEAGRRVQLAISPGSGEVVWGMGKEKEWRGEVEKAGRWLREALAGNGGDQALRARL